MMCRSTCSGKSSRCKTPPLVYSPAHGAVTASLQCCVNFIGCRSRDERNLRLCASYTNRSLQRRQRACLPTFNSSPSMVVLISVHLLTGQWTLVVPLTRTSFWDRSFAAAWPRLWNTLPSTLRQMTSYRQFRRHLKAHLFRSYHGA